MEWQADAVVLGVRRHGETSVIAEIMTRERGRHLGLVRGGRSRAQRPVLQPGNGVLATWRARLPEHMGTLTVEPVAFRAAELMESAAGVSGVQLLAGLLRLLPERDPHPRLYDALLVLLDHLSDPLAAGALVPRFELALLAELGFGLDLSACAATGTRDDLVYVSRKSGRAVSRQAGAPYQDKMLPLPAFLSKEGQGEGAAPAETQILEAFRLTGFFLARHVYEPRGMPEPQARAALLEAVRRAAAG